MIEILIFIFLLFVMSMFMSILAAIKGLESLKMAVYLAILSAIFGGIIFIYIALYGI